MNQLDDIQITQISNMVKPLDYVADLLQRKQPIQFKSAKIYLKCYNFLCQLNNETEILNFIQGWFKKYLNEYTVTLLKEQPESNEFVQKFLDQMEIYKSLVWWIIKLFNYFEQRYAQRKNISEVSIEVLMTAVMKNQDIKSLWQKVAISMINQIRDKVGVEKRSLQIFIQYLDIFEYPFQGKTQLSPNEVVQQELQYRHKTRYQLQQTGQYQQEQADVTFNKYFKKELFESTESYYRNKSSEWIQSGSSSDFVKNSLEQFEIENDIINSFFKPYESEYNEILYKVILDQHASIVINNPNGSGLKYLLESKVEEQINGVETIQQIANMYKLYKKKETNLNKMTIEFENFLKRKGDLLFHDQQANNPQEKMKADLGQIDQVYKLHQFSKNVYKYAFENSSLFRNSVEQAFIYFLNKQQNLPQLLQFYIHYQLKEKFKDNTPAAKQQFDIFLETSERLLAFMNEKLAFFHKYNSGLKQKIFKKEVRNEDYEKETIETLKVYNTINIQFQRQNGDHFPNEISQIWQDYSLSINTIKQPLIKEFEKSQLLKNIAKNISIVIFRKMKNFGEFREIQQINVPSIINEIFNICQNYYENSQRPKSQLQWNLKIGISQITYRLIVKINQSLIEQVHKQILHQSSQIIKLFYFYFQRRRGKLQKTSYLNLLIYQQKKYLYNQNLQQQTDLSDVLTKNHWKSIKSKMILNQN